MRNIVGVAVIGAVLYAALFSLPLPQELVAIPVWTQELANPAMTHTSAQQAAFAFRTGNTFGYATASGELTYQSTVEAGVALADDRYADYSSVGDRIVVCGRDGRVLFNVPSDGYPYMAAQRLFVVSADRRAFTELGAAGSNLWHRDFGSIITSAAATGSELAIGLLSGDIVVIDNQGRVLLDYRPSGSSLPCIFGVALSPNGERIAAVSGLEPQRLLILDRSDGSFVLTANTVLSNPLRHPVPVHIFPGISDVFVESSGKLLRFAGDGGQVAATGSGTGPITGVVSVGASIVDSSSIHSDDPSTLLQVVAPPDRMVCEATLPGTIDFLRSIGTSVYFGADGSLARFDLEER